MKIEKIILPIIIVLAATAFFSIFIVKEINQAIVLQFGDPKRVITEPGLNFKIPFIQNVIFIDPRRNDKQWRFMHLIRLRFILDQLHQVILVQQPFGTTLVAPVAVAGLSGAAAEGQ